MASSGAHTELVLAGLLFSVAVLVTAARVLAVPYPIFLVLGGLAIALDPGIPNPELEPDLVLLIFLPPLLYSASFFTGLRELRENVRQISMLAIGLVLATALAVALVAHAVIDDMSWPAAFVLGAIVSPTDPVAATAIAGRIGVPRRVVTIVEGEALINDATALVAYKVAVAAVAHRRLHRLEGRRRVPLLRHRRRGLRARRRLDHRPGAGAAQRPAGGDHDRPVLRLRRLPAGRGARALGRHGRGRGRPLHGLADLAPDHAGGPHAGRRGVADHHVPPQLDPVPADRAAAAGDPRRPARRRLRHRPSSSSTAAPYGDGDRTRIVWTFVIQYSPYMFKRGVNRRAKARVIAVIAWMGMRGAVSLAAALALPTKTDAGEPFTERPVILFTVFCVILGTLVLQGLTLPWLIRLLRIEADDSDALEQEARARLQAAEAALDRIDDLEREDWTRDETLERMRGLYRYRRNRFAARFDDDVDDGAIEDRSTLYGRMMFAVIDAQREAIEGMRRAGEISDDVKRAVERDLDLEERRLDEVRE